MVTLQSVDPQSSTVAAFLNTFESHAFAAFPTIASSSFALIGSAFVTVDDDGVNTAPILTGVFRLSCN